MSAPFPSRPSEVKSWCIENGFHPNRTLGQNFLIDRNTIDAIVSAANIKAGDHVLEVGPGMGAITRAMLETGAEVTAVEKDEILAALLRESCCREFSNFTLYTSDMLDVSLDAILSCGKTDKEACSESLPYFSKFVSNLPYSVGTRILLDICRHPLAPETCMVMVQKEVADRLAAAPGTNDRGQAGVWVQQSYDVTTVKTVKPTCFWPKPEISSTVVRLTRHSRLPLSIKERQIFESITKLAFMHRRKQMAAIFRKSSQFPELAENGAETWLASAGLQPDIRPENITNEQWRDLSRYLAAKE